MIALTIERVAHGSKLCHAVKGGLAAVVVVERVDAPARKLLGVLLFHPQRADDHTVVARLSLITHLTLPTKA